jgi:membrane protease YdiL (CAAX protease family)
LARGEEVANAEREVRRILARWAVLTLLLVGAMSLWVPERLFAWPREQPGLWLIVFALYPVLSVWPQEVLYRRYFFHRCEPLLGRGNACVIANAVAFAGMHVVFRNVVAVALSLVAGWIFADTYRRTRSLRLVCVEHTCYGLMAFTVGLGDYFAHWNVR